MAGGAACAGAEGDGGGGGLQQQQQAAAELEQQRAGWAALPADERRWLESLSAALAARPASPEEAEQQGRALQQLAEEWNALPAAKQWSTAWAGLQRTQQQQLLAKYGSAGPEALQAAAAAAHRGVDTQQRIAWLSGLSAQEAQLLVAAANVQKQREQQELVEEQLRQREASWEGLPEDERQWLRAQQVVLTAAPQSGEEAAQQGRSLQQLAEQWNAFPPDKQWRTALADLLPHQKQRLLAKYGADGEQGLLAAAGTLFAALLAEERAQLQVWICSSLVKLLFFASVCVLL